MIDDAIMRDIIEARDNGFFDRRKALGPSELESTSVEELLERVAMMSPQKRVEYLESLAHPRLVE